MLCAILYNEAHCILRLILETFEPSKRANVINSDLYGSRDRCMSLLGAAASLGRVECARVLIEFGGIATLKDKNGQSPAQNAEQTGQNNILILIQSLGVCSVSDGVRPLIDKSHVIALQSKDKTGSSVEGYQPANLRSDSKSTVDEGTCFDTVSFTEGDAAHIYECCVALMDSEFKNEEIRSIIDKMKLATRISSFDHAVEIERLNSENREQQQKTNTLVTNLETSTNEQKRDLKKLDLQVMKVANDLKVSQTCMGECMYLSGGEEGLLFQLELLRKTLKIGLKEETVEVRGSDSYEEATEILGIVNSYSPEPILPLSTLLRRALELTKEINTELAARNAIEQSLEPFERDKAYRKSVGTWLETIREDVLSFNYDFGIKPPVKSSAR